MKKSLVSFLILIVISVSSVVLAQPKIRYSGTTSYVDYSDGGTRSVCGAIIADNGGESAYSSTASSFTRTFCAADYNDSIQLAFSVFSLCRNNNSYDEISIYRGRSAVASNLIGTFRTNTSPGIVKTKECLTIVFTKRVTNSCNYGTNRTGWLASLSCIEVPEPFELLPILQTASTGVGSGVTNSRLISGSTQNVCEGLFMDAGGNGDYSVFSESFTQTFCPEGDNVMILNFTEFNLCGATSVNEQDVMEIYAGNNTTNANFLIGRYTRGTSPGTVSNVGCLTVRFIKGNRNTTCTEGTRRLGWKATVNCMPKEYYGNAGNPGYANGSTCFMANPFCSSNAYNFSNLTGTSAPTGPNYGCLYSQPNPVWYFMSISQGGTLRINLRQSTSATSTSSSNGIDIDFAMWGPFNSVAEACNSILSGRVQPIQCSYDPQSNEVIGIGLPGGDDYVSGNFNSNNRPPTGATTPPAARQGDIYVLLFTNYSNKAGFISFSQTDGTAVSDCAIVALPLGPDMISFKGEHSDDANYLEWFSANERSLSKYIVERSEDGFNWIPIYEVNTQITAAESNHYVIEDKEYKNKLNYYRLVSVDVQGRYTYSDIVGIDNKNTNRSVIAVYNEVGQLIDEKTKGFKILVYDDGSTVKKFD